MLSLCFPGCWLFLEEGLSECVAKRECFTETLYVFTIEGAPADLLAGGF